MMNADLEEEIGNELELYMQPNWRELLEQAVNNAGPQWRRQL